jgi:hypothetical protein
MSFTSPMPSHRGHMPAGRLKLKWKLGPTYGWPSREKTMRNMAWASVAVPTVEREFAPMRSWSTMIAAEMLRRLSTSGRDGEPMNDCRNAE